MSMICSSVRPIGFVSNCKDVVQTWRIPYGMLPTKTDLDGGLVENVDMMKRDSGSVKLTLCCVRVAGFKRPWRDGRALLS